jgi:hypothetical protein
MILNDETFAICRKLCAANRQLNSHRTLSPAISRTIAAYETHQIANFKKIELSK